MANAGSGTLCAGEFFPQEWSSRPINSKEFTQGSPRPAARSGLDQRRQPISGKRDHVRASERSRDTGAVGTTLRFAGRLRFFLDAKVDPDGFQPKLGSHRATIAKVDICTPTPFRRYGTSWAPSASTLWHPQRPRSASLRVPMHRRFSHGTVEQAPLE